MSLMPLGSTDAWSGWIGRADRVTQVLEPTLLRQFAAAIGESLDVEHRWPTLGHWAYFHTIVATDQLSDDGHPRRGDFYPPITLKRRMFAAAEIEFHRALVLNEAATLTSRIIDIRRRQGRQGDLVIVDVERSIEQLGASCLRETQSIIYRDARDPGTALAEVPATADPEDAIWQPSPVDLFRFSAATSNSHRIHYDVLYATTVESYPALVVHGPLTAAKLCAYATTRQGGVAAKFRFRALAPIFVSQPVRLRQRAATGQVCALRCDGSVAMEATIEFMD